MTVDFKQCFAHLGAVGACKTLVGDGCIQCNLAADGLPDVINFHFIGKNEDVMDV